MNTSTVATPDRTLPSGPSLRTSLPEWAVGLAAFVVYTLVSLVKHWTIRSTAMDLSIFEQGIAGYAALGAPESTIKGPSVHLLGDHFHPILVVLAPLYRLFPYAETLLIAQAALVALSAGILTRTARERLGSRLGAAFGACYAVSWGVQALVAFDFHEVAFSLPILAVALRFFLQERYRAAALSSLLLLLVKEDLGITVAALGAALVLRRQWRTGIALGITGLAAAALVVAVIVPAFNDGGDYAYLSNVAGAQDDSPLLLRTLGIAVTPMKLLTLFMVGIPTLFLAAFSPLAVLVLPTLAWRLTSTNPLHWQPSHHYNATVMLVVFFAALDALRSERGRRWVDGLAARVRPSQRQHRTSARVFVAGCALVAVVSVAVYPFGRSVTWPVCGHCADARAALAAVPDGVRVAADNSLGPQLSGRTETWLFAPGFVDSTGRRLDVEYVVADLESGWHKGNGWAQRLVPVLRENGYTEVARHGRYVVLRRTGATSGLQEALGSPAWISP